MNRMAILAIYDRDGIVDDYITYLLSELKLVTNTIVVVANGYLREESISALKAYSDIFIQRENVGFDAGAWKCAICQLGNKIDDYDELVLLNDTFYGPLYPFEIIFQKMKYRQIDFWGLTAHGYSPDNYHLSPYGYCPKHIQSYFLVIRKNMLHSEEFHKYWANLPTFNSFEETVCKNEYVFTKTFEDLGYIWDTYIDCSDLDADGKVDHCINNYAFNQYELLKRGFPILKRKNISFEYSMVLNFNNGDDYRKSIEYIRQNTSYDCSMIFKNSCRLYHLFDIYNNLGLTYILSSDYIEHEIDQYSMKIGIIFHSYYIDLFDKMLNIFINLPPQIDLCITTDSVDKKKYIQKKLTSCKNKVCVEIAPRVGRDLAGLLVAAKRFVVEHDLICFTHDKKSPQNLHPTVSYAFFNIITENLLASPEYVLNIIHLFENNPSLGFLGVPSPKLGNYYWGVGKEWTTNFEGTVKLAQELKLNVPFSQKKPPISLGTAFWFRTAAMKKLLDVEWEGRFMPEPLPVDGTISHQLERIFPFVVQDAGFLSGTVCTKQYAEMEIIRLNYFNSILAHNLKCTGKFNNVASFEDFSNNVGKTTSTSSIIAHLYSKYKSKKDHVKVYLPIIEKYSETFSHVILEHKSKNGKITVKYTPKSEFKCLRIDPSEKPCLIAKAMATCTGANLEVTHNGHRFGDKIIFFHNDPSFFINSDVSLKNKELNLSFKIDYNVQCISYAQIYFKQEEYSEKNSTIISLIKSKSTPIHCVITLDPEVSEIRLDPSTVPCVVSSLVISPSPECMTSNGQLVESKYYFMTDDSYFNLKFGKIDFNRTVTIDLIVELI